MSAGTVVTAQTEYVVDPTTDAPLDVGTTKVSKKDRKRDAKAAAKKAARKAKEKKAKAKKHAKKTRKSFAKVIGRKIRNGGRRVKNLLRSTKKHSVRGAKATWRGTKYVARKVTFGVTGALALVGTGLHAGIRWLGVGVVYVLSFVLLCVVGLLTGVVFVAEHLVYLVIKAAHIIGLALCTPWIAFRYGKSVVKDDWQLLVAGLKPRNWSVVHPANLAAQVVRESKTAQRERGAEHADRAADDQVTVEQQPATPPANGRKGRPTPRQRTRRPARLPRTAATPATA